MFSGSGFPAAGPWALSSNRNCRLGISPLDCLIPSCHPRAQLRAWHQTGTQKVLAAQQVTLIVTHIPADSSSCFLAGRQLPWSERNARTLPRQKRASLSTDSQRADSRAVPGVRTGPLSLQASVASALVPSPAWGAKGSISSVSAVLCSSHCGSRASRAEVTEDRILPAPPSSVACRVVRGCCPLQTPVFSFVANLWFFSFSPDLVSLACCGYCLMTTFPKVCSTERQFLWSQWKTTTCPGCRTSQSLECIDASMMSL